MKLHKRLISILLCILTVLSCSLFSCNVNPPSDSDSDGVSDTNTDTDTDTDSGSDNGPALTIDQLNKKDEVLATLDNNYLSRNEIVYENINGKDVTVYTTFRAKNEIQNNPNFSQIQMVWQAIK